VAALVALFEAYMREAYADRWHGSPEALYRDALGQQCSICVAVATDGARVGFLAWVPSYDLLHCLPGAEVLDLYVAPRWRGRGLALLLGCAAAERIERGGGRYLKGSTVRTGSGRRLYARIGICDEAGCIVSGRAFRQLARLAGRPIREVLRALPEPPLNYEA
jgi:GNAT superfamily N-acetyltransferase